MAKGFCTCKRDFPGEVRFHPPAGASWHYLCDKPVLEFVLDMPVTRPTGTGWPS